jgi:phage tail-like protein
MLPAIYRQLDTEDKVLKRFLDIFGSEFDVIQTYAEFFTNIFDVDSCDAKFFPYLSQYVGADYFEVLKSTQIRNYIKGAVYTYTVKGTKNAIETHVSTLTGWDPVTVVEHNSLTSGMMLTNVAGLKTFNSATYPALVALIGPIAAYALQAKTWDGISITGDYMSIRIFCETHGDPDRTTKENLLNESLKTQVPAGVTWTFVYVN